MSKFVPMQHPQKVDLWRTPLIVIDQEKVYEVYMNGNVIFRYDKPRLPNCIKEKLSMISSFPNAPTHDLNGLLGGRLRAELGVDLYINRHDPRLDDIGWQCAKDVYIIILSEEEHEQLKEDYFHGNDTRSKS